MTVDIWIRDYNPPRCFQKKIYGRGKHNASVLFTNDAVFDFSLSFLYFLSNLVEKKNPNRNTKISWFI
jgi:hypothetical protein